MMTMTQTPETTPAIAAARKNFDRLTHSSYCNSMCQFGTIHFTDTGKARMAHTVGFLQAIHVFDPMRAYELADDLCKYLEYLGGYAGMLDSPEGNADFVTKAPLQFPAYRVVLGDDGGIGSFSIGWYRAIPHKAMMDLAETIAESLAMERHQKHNNDLNSDDARPIWDEALEQAKTKLNLRKELEECRMYRPKWDTDKTFGYDREYVLYGYCHNGGLIFHHDQKDITRGHWSTHT